MRRFVGVCGLVGRIIRGWLIEYDVESGFS